MNKIILITILLFLFGCAVTDPRGDYFYDASHPKINEDYALICFYRDSNRHAFKKGKVNIYINDSKIMEIINNSFTWFYLEPGIYHFKAEWPAMSKPMFEKGVYDIKELSLSVEAGKKYYLNYRINDDMETVHDRIGPIAKVFKSKPEYATSAIVIQEEEKALAYLKNYRFQTNTIMQE